MREAAPGPCGCCRHANHGTEDAAEGLWACPWVGRVGANDRCSVRRKADGGFVFELLQGGNGTWEANAPFRTIPAGFEGIEMLVGADAAQARDFLARPFQTLSRLLRKLLNGRGS